MARPACKRLAFFASGARSADLIAVRRGEAALLAAGRALARRQCLGRRTLVVVPRPRLIAWRLIARRLVLRRLRKRGAGRARQRGA
jgi:hypothetical protein